jgi:hypothetical protein
VCPASTTGVVSICDTDDFADFGTLYDEFRVLGIEVFYPPYNYTDGSSRASLAIRSMTNLPDLTMTYAQATSFDGFRFHSTTSPNRMSVKMSGLPEAQWMTTNLGVPPPPIYSGVGHVAIVSGAVAATTITFYCSWRVQFRSAKSIGSTAARRAPRQVPAILPQNGPGVVPSLVDVETAGESDGDDQSEMVLVPIPRRALKR